MRRNHWKSLKGMVLHEKRFTIAPFQTFDQSTLGCWRSSRYNVLQKCHQSILLRSKSNETKLELFWIFWKKINSALAVKTSFPMIIPGLFWENLVIAPENFFHFSMTTSSKHLVRGKFSWKDSRSWTKIFFVKFMFYGLLEIVHGPKRHFYTHWFFNSPLGAF